MALQATTDVGVAFAIWSQFQQAKIQSSADLKTVWKAVLDSCTPDTLWDECGFQYPTMLAGFAIRLLPICAVPPDVFSIPEADLVTNISPQAKACLWLPKLLLSHCSVPASTSLESYVTEIRDSAKQGSVPEPPPGNIEAQASAVSTLKRALMLLKLISFLASIKCKAAGVHKAEDLLWNLLTEMLLSCDPVAAHENISLQDAHTSEQLILYLLLEMLVFQACQLISAKAGRDVLHATKALKILKSLITGLHVPALRLTLGSKLLKQGMQSNLANSYQHKQRHE